MAGRRCEQFKPYSYITLHEDCVPAQVWRCGRNEAEPPTTVHCVCVTSIDLVHVRSCTGRYCMYIKTH